MQLQLLRWRRVSAFVLTFAAFIVVFWPRRRRLLQLSRVFIHDALAAQSNRLVRYAALFDVPTRAVRGYIDDRAGRMYTLLSKQFELRLDAIVDAAIEQAKRVAIDPDMPQGVSDLIADTFERAGPEIVRAIRRHAEVTILTPLARRFRPLSSETLPQRVIGALPLHADIDGSTLNRVIVPPLHRPPEHDALGHISPRRRPLLFQPTSSFRSAALRITRFALLMIARFGLIVASACRAARSHVLYTLQPFDRSMWACFKNPQVLSRYVQSLDSIPL
jgi:hypothetical protein